MKAGAILVRDTLKKFPNAPALTIAKKLYAEYPQLWSGVEACRTAVRTALGVNGNKKRRVESDKTLYREPRKAGDWKDYMPIALHHYEQGWAPFALDGPLRVLTLADLHVPYHDVAAVEAAIEHGIKEKANCVLLNGDVVDHFALSFWETDPRKRDFPREVKAGQSFLDTIKRAFPKARIIWKEGNHEERFERYLRMKAPELLGLDDFSWEHVYELNKLKITRVGDKRPVRLGKLNVLHGHEYRFAIQNPVNPARGLFLRAKTHCMAGHFHRSSEHSGKSLEEHVVTCFSTGALCDMHPSFLPLNEWNAGFAFVEVSKDGSFAVQNLRVIKGRVY